MGMIVLWIIGVAKAPLLILVGVTGCKGVSARDPSSAAKMFRRVACLIVSLLVLSVVGMVLIGTRLRKYEGYGDGYGEWEG